jgi:hypothetical protein
MHIADKTRYANNYDILLAKKIKDIYITINHRRNKLIYYIDNEVKSLKLYVHWVMGNKIAGLWE